MFYARFDNFEGALWMIRTSMNAGVFMGYPAPGYREPGIERHHVHQ